MKRLAYILMASALVLTACAKEQYEHPSEINAPRSASDYNPTITVDQSVNQVTFTLGEKAIIPVWVFQNSAGEWSDIHARDEYKRIFAVAGDYSVRMYVMNASGMSPDYVEKTFHIDNTIMSFDKYIRQISGGSEKVWRIDNSVAAHQACGESIGNPTGWWAAKPDEKAAFGIYDNRLIFSAAGEYTFDPGEAGTVYVNTGVNVAPYGAYQEGSDYVVPVTTQTSQYQFGVEGSDIVLKLDNGALFPYIPNNDYVNDSKFYLISLDNSSMTLVWYTATGNGGGPIAWQFILTSKEPGSGGGEKPEQPGGYTYGPSLIDGLFLDSTWFSAGDWSGGLDPNAKFEGGKLTLTVPDGVGGAEWQGQVKLVANVPADPEKKYSFSCKIESSSDGTCTVKVADAAADAEHAFFYDNNVGLKAYEAVSYKNEPVSPDQAYEAVMVIYDFGRIPAGTEITVTDIKLCEVTGESSGSQGGYTYGEELLGGLYYHSDWFSPASWAGGLDPQLTFEGGKVTLTVPAEVGGAEWQGQLKLVADIPADPAKQYSFACNVEASMDGVCTIKVADAAADAEHAFFYDNNVALSAYDVKAYKNEPIVPDQAYEAVMVIFDFGRMAPGTEITITGISLKEITGEVSGGGGNSGSAYGDNILGGLYFHSHWFSPANWSGGLDPQLTFEGGKVTLTVPEVGGAEWQGQVKLVADVPADPAIAYEFTCKVESSTDGTCTIKVADAAADAEHAFFYDNNVALTAYDVISYKNEPVSPDQAYEAIMVIYDFGRMAPGTEIVITDIALRPQK